MPDDWFRNRSWNQDIEQQFFEKLKRARQKGQYLRIQASMLSHSHPQVTLELLEHYFSIPNDFDQAQAHVDRAEALLALRRDEEAINSYEAALVREAEYPKLLTQAYLDLPWLIVSRGMQGRYGRALQILEAHESRLMFRVDRFRWNAARCLIAASQQDLSAAQSFARRALEAASDGHSGFRYHPKVGIVGDENQGVIETLKVFSRSRG
jgi:tetratricopeptide (TPR) repeat protein